MTSIFVSTLAQHIEFIGIPLGQPTGVFCNSLKQKGFNRNYYFKQPTFSGDFWKFKNVEVDVISDNGLVCCVSVSTSEDYPLSTYNNLVNSFTKKYGKYTTKEGYDYTWKVKGGEITTLYYNSNFLGKHTRIMIMYIDRTSTVYIRKYQKRDPNNDL